MSPSLRRHPLALCLLAALPGAPSLAAGATQHVGNCNDAGAGSLRAAVAAAASGDTVVFDTATMACDTILLTSGEIAIAANVLTLQGPASGTLTIDGGHNGRVLSNFRAGAVDRSLQITVNDLTISNGLAQVTAPNARYLATGGCIESMGDVTLNNSTVSGCSVMSTSAAAEGGAIYTYTLHMLNSRVAYNHAYTYLPAVPAAGFTYVALGGGIFAGGGVVIQSSTIESNQAYVMGQPSFTLGGGLAGSGNMTITGSSISGNATDGAGGGLGIYASDYAPGNIVIDRSTIADNAAASAGGVSVYNVSGTTTISNSTISGNSASGLTGGILTKSSSNTFINDTVVLNTAGTQSFLYYGLTVLNAAGIYADSTTLFNTIVANNTATDSGASDFNVPSGSAVGGSNNLIRATLAGTTAPAGTLTADPMLGPFANNGGSTWTYALLAGSPAIDAGTRCAPGLAPTDQRGPGYPRSWNVVPDIGAFEYGDPASGDIIFRGAFDGQSCGP